MKLRSGCIFILLSIVIPTIKAELESGGVATNNDNNLETSATSTILPIVEVINISSNGIDPGLQTTDSNSAEEASSSDKSLEERMSDLISFTEGLESRIAVLENKLASLEGSVASVKHEVHFHHPTMEVQYVDMQVVQWKEALKNGLRKIAIQFQAGYSLGAVSTWEFSLANESDALTVNLLLIEEKYGKGALFSGFTAYILDTEGNMHSQANALPVNFLDGNGRNLHLPNVIALSDISNSSNGLLSDDDVFKIRFRLELLGVGHKLYPDLPPGSESASKDTQTVVFDVDNILTKISQNQELNNQYQNKSPVAYTRFSLKHDAWNMKTDWSAELHSTGDEDDALSLYIALEKAPWTELYASFHVEVWDFLNKRLIQSQGTPINNFMKDRITIEPLLSHLRETYDEDEAVSLRFKLQFIVYGKNARYYADVV